MGLQLLHNDFQFSVDWNMGTLNQLVPQWAFLLCGASSLSHQLSFKETGPRLVCHYVIVLLLWLPCLFLGT